VSAIDEYPAISVVIPTRGRPGALAACLAGLGRSTLAPEALEIIVVGDGEDVSGPAADAAGRFGFEFHTQPHSGPAAARNRGARLARAPVVAFTDDDCVPVPAWAERMHAEVTANPSAVVAGVMRNGLPGNPWSSAGQLVHELVIDMYNGRPGWPGFAPTSNIAMRRDVFEALGGFDERFRSAAAEDREFCDRCFAEGHALLLTDTAVDHFHHLDARGLWRQFEAYGRGERTYRAVCAERGRPPNLIRHHFYRKLVARALSPRRTPRGPGLAARALLSQIAFKVGDWGARRRGGA
jgi:GT2 family glycosyltransferase